MTTRLGRRRCAATVLLLAGLASMPTVAAADMPTAAAVVVHLLGAPSPTLPAGAAEMRRASLDLAAALLQSRGLTIVDRAGTEALVRRHVVRSGQSFGKSFLTDLAAGTGAELLVAIAVRAEGNRLTAGARFIDTGTGGLLGIGLAEADVDTAGWRHALATTLRDALPLSLAPGTGMPLVVLPARAVGTGTPAAQAATSCLLAAALADGRWQPLDPALVADAVAAEGCDLERLDGRAREVLRERCGVSWVLVPEIVSFDDVAGAGTRPSPEFDESGAGLQSRLSEFTVNLRLLDLRTGLVQGGTSAHRRGGPVHGWFGLINHPSELERIRTAAGRAWSRFQGFLQEKAS